MKTITEFNAFDLELSIKKLAALVSSGKTAEEAQQAFAEEKKLEGDKLKLYMSAMEIAKARNVGLKRIIVSTAAEGEKIPSNAEKKDEHYFTAEFFPAAPQAARRGNGRFDNRGDRGGRDGGRGRDGKGREGKGRGDKGRDRNPNNRGPRPPRNTTIITPNAGAGTAPQSVTTVAGIKVSYGSSAPPVDMPKTKKPRRERTPRKPIERPNYPVEISTNAEGKMVIKLVKPAAPAGAASPEPAATPETSAPDKT